jgi:hypothetical protein
MIISNDQVQRVLAQLKGAGTSACEPSTCRDGVSLRLLERARASVESAPEIRLERVERARLRLADGVPSDEVAEKMIGRLISDGLR